MTRLRKMMLEELHVVIIPKIRHATTFAQLKTLTPPASRGTRSPPTGPVRILP